MTKDFGIGCVDDYAVKIDIKDFWTGDYSCEKRVAWYKQSHKDSNGNEINPKIVYTLPGGTDYVTFAKYMDMYTREETWLNKNKTRPNFCWVTKDGKDPVGASSIIVKLENILGGTINSLTDYYTLLQQKGIYSHYDCRKYANDINTAITKITNTGLNCADYTNVTIPLIKALNSLKGKDYSYTIMHVCCNNSSHKTNWSSGHFFLRVEGGEFSKITDFDPAEAASGKRAIGSTMCTYGYNSGGIVGHTLC